MKVTTIIAAFALSLLFVQTAVAQNVWTGSIYAGGNDWHSPYNWSKGHVPTDLEDVVIPDLANTGKPYPVISDEAEARHVRILGHGRLNVTNQGTLYLSIHEGYVEAEEMAVYTAADVDSLNETPSYSAHRRTASIQ